MTATTTAATTAENAARWGAALRLAGLRVTAPRIAALESVAVHHHVDADTVAADVRAKLGTVSKQTVYDVFSALSEAGLVRKISVSDRRALYELNQHDNHHHLVCRICERIEDIDCAAGEAPCIHLGDGESHGFAVDQAEVTFRGICPDCAAQHH